VLPSEPARGWNQHARSGLVALLLGDPGEEDVGFQSALPKRDAFYSPVFAPAQTYVLSVPLLPSSLSPFSPFRSELGLYVAVQSYLQSMENIRSSTFAFCILAICCWNFNAAIEATAFSVSLPVSPLFSRLPLLSYSFHFR